MKLLSRYSIFFLCVIIIILYNSLQADQQADVSIVGITNFQDGIARVPIVWIDMLKDVFKVNFIPTAPANFTDMPLSVQSVINNNTTPAKNVAILCDLLWSSARCPAACVPNSKIKIAYSMLETTKLPHQWVTLLNTQFDAVVVPDNYLIDVYCNSGVKIPVFMIPLGLYLDEFLQMPLKKRRNRVFTFGISAGFGPDKNHAMVINAFTRNFANKKNIRLRVHGRHGHTYEEFKRLIKAQKINNIEILYGPLSQAEYLAWFNSLDCYVLLSKGEGFSITPREAMALGIPCILSNMSAHKTLCSSGLVRAVEAPYVERASYNEFASQFVGYKFNCTLTEARKALSDVYTHYNFYVAKASQARYWVKRYDHRNIKAQAITLVKPTQIIFDPLKNIVGADCLITNSQALYKKYQELYFESQI